MGTATGLTAARMQEIIDQQILAGAVDLSGNLIMTRANGTEFSAGAVKGERGDPAVYVIPGFPSGSSGTYVRLGVLDGLSESAGASWQFMLSGLGGYGSRKRGTVLVHVGQRNADLVELYAWAWGLSDLTAGSFRIFTRQTGPYLFEVWGYYSTYSGTPTLSDLSSLRSTLTLDEQTSTIPSNLAEWGISRADYVLPDDISINSMTLVSVLTARTARLTGTGDLSLSSTGHAFQIGASDGFNMAMDNNEMMARNNGEGSQLNINLEGGDIALGHSSATTRIPGRIDGAHYPYAYAAGVANVDTSFPFISLPSGRFTKEPIVTAQLLSGSGGDIGIGVMVTAVTTASFRMRHDGGSGSKPVAWHAIQMKPGSGAG